MNEPLTDAEVESLKACRNESAWNAACDAIKAARQGSYPSDWWPKMQMSGLMSRIIKAFDK